MADRRTRCAPLLGILRANAMSICSRVERRLDTMRTIHTLTFLLAALCAPLLATAHAETPPAAAKPATGKYASINGLQLYYEIHGSGGRPLVLLHGALCTIDGCFGKLIPALAKGRQVIAIEQQAHGHTADIDRPLSAAVMADDTIQLLAQLKITSADFLGYSMGSNVAVAIALAKPALVHKLVLISVATTKAGMQPGLAANIGTIKPEMFFGSPLYEAYVKAAPSKDGFPKLVARVKQLMASVVDVPVSKVAAIKAPVLLVSGDSDMARPEHTIELYRAFGGGAMGDMGGLPRSQLMIVPAASHMGIMERFGTIADAAIPFLDRVEK
jgi:pimeloyl-ACP methyl ester carboxylesterase